MDIGTLLLIALVLVCPLTMFWMMRGHGKKTGAAPPEEHGAKKVRSAPAEPDRKFDRSRGRMR